MGILYSRSIGVLSSKGEYIFSLDNDDMYLNYNVFSDVTAVVDKGKFDIVEYKALRASKKFKDIFNSGISIVHGYNKNTNEVLFQPKLGNYQIELSKNLGSFRWRTVFLWTKCIKARIYKNALNRIGRERYTRFLTKHEDLVMVTCIFNEANSYKFISKFGTLYLIREESESLKIYNKTEMIRWDLYWTDVII